MTITEKALAAILKDISITLHTIGAKLISGPSRKYSTVKANYFYGKAEKDVEKWLAEIDQMIKTNNVAMRRRVTVAATHLRDITANWYEANKENIAQYADRVAGSFIK